MIYLKSGYLEVCYKSASKKTVLLVQISLFPLTNIYQRGEKTFQSTHWQWVIYCNSIFKVAIKTNSFHNLLWFSYWIWTHREEILFWESLIILRETFPASVSWLSPLFSEKLACAVGWSQVLECDAIKMWKVVWISFIWKCGKRQPIIFHPVFVSFSNIHSKRLQLFDIARHVSNNHFVLFLHGTTVRLMFKKSKAKFQCLLGSSHFNVVKFNEPVPQWSVFYSLGTSC